MDSMVVVSSNSPMSSLSDACCKLDTSGSPLASKNTISCICPNLKVMEPYSSLLLMLNSIPVILFTSDSTFLIQSLQSLIFFSVNVLFVSVFCCNERNNSFKCSDTTMNIIQKKMLRNTFLCIFIQPVFFYLFSLS
jgi:hypothetical protein